jgi:membrane protein implicated in regulation of membrane protease activity
MGQSTIARGLLILGALVGTAAGVALALGFGVADIPSWMITVGMYKLAFIAAGGLLFAGAVLGRAANRHRPKATGDRVVGPGQWSTTDRPPRESEPVDAERRRHDGA